ncbi:MAG: FTR1 family protein, partial [Candidatus Nitrosopolaris sp.]
MKKSKKIEKIKDVQYTRISSFAVVVLASLILTNVFMTYCYFSSPLYASTMQSTTPTAAAPTSKIKDTDALVLMVNFERIHTQLTLTEENLAGNNKNDAFAHAYLIHSVIFPSIKNILDKSGSSTSANQLLSASTDLAFGIKSTPNSLAMSKDLTQAKDALNNMYDQLLGPFIKLENRTLLLQTSAVLLDDANKSYQGATVGKSGNNAIDNVNYQNAIALTNTSKANHDKLVNTVDKNRNVEIDLSYGQLQNYMLSKSNSTSISHLISVIQNKLMNSLSASSNSNGNNSTLPSAELQYFSTIRSDLQDALKDVKNGNYHGADDTVVSAYLDNFEYLEPPIDNLDHKLKLDIELGIREHLRQMLTAKAPYNQVVTFVDGILLKLNSAQELLTKHSPATTGANTHTNMTSSGIAATLNGKALANIQGLSEGFGVYTGERHSMGQSSESAKGMVRGDIDQIRTELDDMLQLYKKGSYDQAFSTSRSAYLDNFENIELPLRPINPDFTLDMEIKFAQLRNLIESKAPYEKVQDKTGEIKQGLDESEREVSGTGVIAPAISFSGSFSIIFREGLESALIIAAILTYIEASRNERFKKHVYVGIVIAVAATAVTWFIAQYIIEISGANRELIEAIAGLSAVAVLFWVSFWVLNKIETKKWIEFVKAKVWKATTTGSVIVFAMLSFFTVYREGFETVLFYQALLSFAKYMEWYVVAGFISGLALILCIVYIIRKLGKKLPLRLLFGVTMGVGAYMSIVFIGNAVRSFQELGYIPTTPMIGIIPRFDINVAEMTGIHPTLESVVAQLILLS